MTIQDNIFMALGETKISQDMKHINREKNDKLNIIKIKKFCLSKATFKKMKSQKENIYIHKLTCQKNMQRTLIIGKT